MNVWCQCWSNLNRRCSTIYRAMVRSKITAIRKSQYLNQVLNEHSPLKWRYIMFGNNCESSNEHFAVQSMFRETTLDISPLYRTLVHRQVSQSLSVGGFHLCSSSTLLSGRSWLRMPPRTFEVASVAIITGSRTVDGIWRSTPPTAPVIPLCSCSSTATL